MTINLKKWIILSSLGFILATSVGIKTSFAQQSIMASGGEGTGSGGTFSFSIGQFAYQTYFSNYSSIEEGVQHPFETTLVPSLFLMANSNISSGTIGCYNALQYLTVAGDGNLVTIQSSAVTDYIAGSSIRFLPGFHSLQGSIVHGFITTNNSFCDGPISSSVVEVQPEEKSLDTLALNKGIFNIAASGRNMDSDNTFDAVIYPNPNNGNFHIRLTNCSQKANIKVYNLIGTLFFESVIDQNGSFDINIPSPIKGAYFVSIRNNQNELVKKMIVK